MLPSAFQKAQSEEAKMLSHSSAVRPQPLRVLVVDDDELDRFVIRRSFNALDEPVELIEVSDPHEAVDAIQTHDPDVTLLDIQMPGMNGFEVLQALEKADQASFAQHAVMMLSSSTRQEDRERAISLGATEYRTKPSTLNDYIRLAEDIHTAYFLNE